MRLFLLFLCLLATTAPAYANDLATLRDAVRAADSNQYSRAIALAQRAGFPFVADAFRGEAYAEDTLGASYAEIAEFLAAYPVFPNRRTLVSAAEGYMSPDAPPRDLDKLYTGDARPVSLNGFTTTINFMLQNGQRSEAVALVRERWVNGPLASGDDTAFRRQYDNFLGVGDDVARLDRLVWEQESVAAQRLYSLVSSDWRALAEARLALQRGDVDGHSKMQRVPQHLQNDPGLLYARVRYRRENDDTRGAVDLLGRINGAPSGPSGDFGGSTAEEAWWTERHIIIRRLIEQRDFRTAYNLAAQHGLTPSGKTAGDFAAAEFMAGWLALRFIEDASRAATHFDNLHKNVTQPVSRSRGAYWLGRAFEAQGDKERARQWYSTGAEHALFFYGQLSMAKLGQNTLTLPAEEPMPPEVRARFTRQPLVQIVKAFNDVRDHDRARKFLRALLPSLGTRAEFAYAAELGRAIGPEMEVEAAKAANTKGFTLTGYGYPTVRLGERSVPEAALTLGLIRQESQFQSDAESPANAKGLMQLLPSSARQIAKKYDEPYGGPDSLFNPNTNITLGRHYLADRIAQFDGSYIKAIAAYNAGQGRVRQFEESIGDPKQGMDPIDWIEMIPIYETRNYVQRVLEGTQVYRALLNRGSAPLRITSDLMR